MIKVVLIVHFSLLGCTFRVSGAMVARGTPNAEAPGSSPGWRCTFCIMKDLLSLSLLRLVKVLVISC